MFDMNNYWTPPGVIACGKCSICGGLVTIPKIWMSIVPPVPTCQGCGATAAPPEQPELPVIPMVPVRHVYKTSTGIDYRNGPVNPSSSSNKVEFIYTPTQTKSHVADRCSDHDCPCHGYNP